MRLRNLASSILLCLSTLAACAQQAQAPLEVSGGGKEDHFVIDQCGDGCGPDQGCLIECADDARTQCTKSCAPFGSECTQSCGTSRYNGMYLFCAGHENTCIPFPDRSEYGCSSYVYAQNDPANCGMCNTQCVSCNNMVCSCSADGSPTNLFVDPNNCGGCGRVCPSGKCALAECQP